MTIQKNSRQVPNSKEIIVQKDYSDILYCYLQVISKKNDKGPRLLTTKDLNQTRLSEVLEISRPTIKKKLKHLIDLDLLIPPTEDCPFYQLRILSPDEAFLVPQETLRKMISALKERTIDVYVYLANRYYANKGVAFDFSITGLKAYCGLGCKTSNNNYVITDILEVLQKLGLIEYKKENKRGQDGQIKCVYTLLNLSYSL